MRNTVVGVVAVATSLVLLVGCSDNGKPGTPVRETGDSKKEASPPNTPDGKVYKSPAELFAGMPKDAYPRGGEGGKPERDAATDWMKKNRVEQQIELRVKVKSVAISAEGKGYRVELTIDGEQTNYAIQGNSGGWVLPWGEPITLAAEKIQVALPMKTVTGYRYLAFAPISSDSAKKVREWEGKEAVLRATLTGINFLTDNLCDLRVTLGTIDGYAPPLLKE